MPRRYEPELLAFSASLSPEDRLRQANAAFRLYHQLHRPFRTPYYRGFDSYADFNAFTESARVER